MERSICRALILSLSFIVLVTIIFVTGQRPLTNADLLSEVYDEIHRRAVLNQVHRYTPAQKSLNTRYTKSLDGLYDFCFDDTNQGFAEEWYSKSLRQTCRQGNFYRMPVPSAFNDITSNKTARNYIGWFWYQTEFSLPPHHGTIESDLNEPAKHWFVQFENVNYLSVVWLQRMTVTLDVTPNSSNSSNNSDTNNNNNNTYLLGSHVGGHLPFQFNITDALGSRHETSARFRLTIAVSNLLTKDTIPGGRLLNLSEPVGYSFYKFQPDFDFFHFAGILAGVNLIQLASIHIRRVDFANGPLLSSSSPNCFDVYLGGYIQPSKPVELSIEAQLLGPNEEQLGRSRLLKKNLIGNLDEAHKVEFHKLHDINDKMKWSLANGNLNHVSPLVKVRFRLEISIDNGFTLAGNQLANSFQTIIDTFELKIGVGGGILLDHRRGFSVGSELIRRQLQGFGMHHEQLFSGRSMNQAAIMKDIYLLKQIGANVIRTSHYPYSNEYLEACDENGIMVIAECPAVGLSSFSELRLMLHKQILLEMMHRDHHHPSIVMWSVANEPQSQLKAAQGYFESLLEYARKDLSQYIVGRPLTAAIAQSHTDDKVAHTLDVIMVNRYYGWYDYTGVIQAIRLPLLASLSGWSLRYPGKPLILSEFGADTVSGLHSSTSEMFSEEYQDNLLLQYESVFDELFCANTTDKYQANFWGSMIWNFADFSTHDSLLRVAGNKKGIYNKARQPKLSASNIAAIYMDRLRNGCSRYKFAGCRPMSVNTRT